LIDLKSQWATFGALSDNELNFIVNASNNLDLWTKRWTLQENLQEYKRILQKWIETSWWTQADTTSSWWTTTWGRWL
jgi:hypothetical protein